MRLISAVPGVQVPPSLPLEFFSRGNPPGFFLWRVISGCDVQVVCKDFLDMFQECNLFNQVSLLLLVQGPKDLKEDF